MDETSELTRDRVPGDQTRGERTHHLNGPNNHSSVRAAVIGSGFGGLSAAIRLQAAGFDVRIFEKCDQLGGRAAVYHDQGFTFDAGPTVITAPQCLEELFAAASASGRVSGRAAGHASGFESVRRVEMRDYVELLPVTPFYRLLWEDGYRFDYASDLDSTLSQIRARSPRDADGYQRFLRYSEEVFAQGYTKLAHVPFLNWWSMVKVSPDLVRLKAYRSVYDIVSSFIKDEKFRQAFSFHSLLVGGNPFSTSSIYTLIHHLERKWGVFFPKGGTGALVRGLGKLFTDLGGEYVLNSEVSKIETDEYGHVEAIRTKSGSVWKCDFVISNADVVHTYRDLLAGEERAEKKAKRLAQMKHSMSLFLIYFGTRKRYPELAHHNVLFGPRYKDLLGDIFTQGNLPKDFSLYLHAPTVSDPSMAPPGCEAFYVLSPVPHLGHADRIDWKQEAKPYADRILSYMEKHYLPGLRENLVCQKIFTPDDFGSRFNSHHGAAFSLEPLLTQSAYFRTSNRDPNIKGLYVVGAGTHPGAGIPGVVNSAKATSALVIEDAKPMFALQNVRCPTH